MTKEMKNSRDGLTTDWTELKRKSVAWKTDLGK